MASEDAALDAVVDSILLGDAHTSPPPSNTHAPTAVDACSNSNSNSSKTKEERNSVEAKIWHRSQPSQTKPSASPQAQSSPLEESHDAEDDLNALVERILAGPSSSASPALNDITSHPLHLASTDAVPPASSETASSSSSHHHRHRQHVHGFASPHIASPSVSPASSSPRYQPSQHSHTALQQQQQQQQRSSASGSSAAASRRTHDGGGGGGAVRADPSLSRGSGGGFLNASSAVARLASSPSPTDAVVRRLTLWQERREAKRVQSVYEALEKEQEDCTFEPSINRLGADGSRSASVCGRYRSTADGALNVEVEAGEEHSGSQPLRVSSIGRAASRHSNGNNAERGGRASSFSYTSTTELVPALRPPTQPIYGVETFIERLRKAQEERDATKAQEEAKRLRYYDAATFQRDITVPEPFEFGDTRPRRPPMATMAVARGISPAREGTYGLRIPALSTSPSRVTLTPSAWVAGRTTAAKHVQSRSPLEMGVEEEGYTHVHLSGLQEGAEEEEEEDRMTAENTFLSLAPQIRESLLFDRQMELQLQRATESIRRGTV